MTSLTMNNQGRVIWLVDRDTEHPHRLDCAPAIMARQKSLDRAGAVRHRSQNNGSMGDAFIPRYYYLRFDMWSPSNT